METEISILFIVFSCRSQRSSPPPIGFRAVPYRIVTVYKEISLRSIGHISYIDSFQPFPMRRGWKVPALYLATTCTSSHFALGFVSHQLSTAAKASAWKPASSLIYGSPSSGSTFTRRNMSSEVVPAEDYGPTDQSWRSLLEVSMARSRKIRGSNYVQISTATKDGEPRCRTVVFRGFLNNKNLPEDHPMSASGNVDGKPCVMKMCTDLRSNKVAEVAHQPISEMVRQTERLA